jgi:murein DD-endopeptidase MepM/ murein hydrolase activator NlpD
MRLLVGVLVASLAWLLQVSAQTGPPPPTGFAATATAGGLVTLTWTPPAGAGPFTYIIEAGSGPGLANLATVPVTTSTVSFAGVPSGTYYLRVRASDARGTSVPSNEAALVVGAGGGAPGVPRNFVATVPAAGTIALTWDAPSIGSAVTGYLLEAGTTSGAANLGQFPVGNRTSYTAPGVPFGTYYLRLRATNAFGTSPATAEVSLTVGESYACGDGPNARNRVLRLFGSPFRGRFELLNHFDHDLPIQFEHANGYVINHCGTRITNSFDGHSGHDFRLPDGTPLSATASGQIVFAGEAPPFNCPVVPGGVATGLYVEIRHPAVSGEVFQSSYAHLSRVDVRVGQSVTRGQLIGLSGNTGCSTGPHLHFQVFRLTNTNSGTAVRVDPYGWEAATPDPWAVDPRGASSFWLWLPGEAPPLR